MEPDRSDRSFAPRKLRRQCWGFTTRSSWFIPCQLLRLEVARFWGSDRSAEGLHHRSLGQRPRNSGEYTSFWLKAIHTSERTHRCVYGLRPNKCERCDLPALPQATVKRRPSAKDQAAFPCERRNSKTHERRRKRVRQHITHSSRSPRSRVGLRLFVTHHVPPRVATADRWARSPCPVAA